jgi:hypothetical protein
MDEDKKISDGANVGLVSPVEKQPMDIYIPSSNCTDILPAGPFENKAMGEDAMTNNGTEVGQVCPAEDQTMAEDAMTSNSAETVPASSAGDQAIVDDQAIEEDAVILASINIQAALAHRAQTPAHRFDRASPWELEITKWVTLKRKKWAFKLAVRELLEENLIDPDGLVSDDDCVDIVKLLNMAPYAELVLPNDKEVSREMERLAEVNRLNKKREKKHRKRAVLRARTRATRSAEKVEEQITTLAVATTQPLTRPSDDHADRGGYSPRKKRDGNAAAPTAAGGAGEPEAEDSDHEAVLVPAKAADGLARVKKEEPDGAMEA